MIRSAKFHPTDYAMTEIMKKTVLITGASSGIGEGCARKFASQGARLILNARSTDKLTALALDLEEKYNADCYVMPFDVCDRESAAAALNALPGNGSLLMC